jgi:hypothetical protein
MPPLISANSAFSRSTSPPASSVAAAREWCHGGASGVSGCSGVMMCAHEMRSVRARLLAAASLRRRWAWSPGCRPPRSAPAALPRACARSARRRAQRTRRDAKTACARKQKARLCVVCDHQLVARVLQVIQQLLRPSEARVSARERRSRRCAGVRSGSVRAFLPSSSAATSCSRLLRRPKLLMFAWSSRVTSGVPPPCVRAAACASAPRRI